LTSLFISYTHTHIYTSVTNYVSVADNARDAYLLHVSSSNERQECGNNTGLKQGTKHDILKFYDVCVSFSIVVLFHR